MREPGTRRVIEWGHVALLAVFSAVVIAYLLDARRVSTKIGNLLLVEPASIIALVLVLLVLPQVLVSRAARSPDERWEERFKVLRVAALAAAFGLMVFFMERIGFDVATFLFVAVGLFICGERKLWLIALFSAVFTAAVIYGYQLLVPYPFPLLVL